MKVKEHSLIIAGNVYYCDFGKTVVRNAPRVAPVLGSRDVRLAAETLQGACRDLIADAPGLVRCSEINAADLVSVASMIDELAFQAHIMALEGGNEVAPAMDAEGLQELLIEAAAVTSEIQSCMSHANTAAEQLLRRLRVQAERALRLGRGMAQALDTAARGETPTAC